jgi:hypothetical protein
MRPLDPSIEIDPAATALAAMHKMTSGTPIAGRLDSPPDSRVNSVSGCAESSGAKGDALMP